ncbi:MAG: CatA-like O-acetyltransferase [Actinomycetaceae bacterium]
MAHAEPIDTATWPRRELFAHYRHRRPTYYSITVDLDVTALRERLRERGRRMSPALVWALATVVNRHEEFRMTLDDAGEPATWDVVDPSFTVLNPERETFANVWTPYDPDVDAFHDRAAALMDEHRSATTPFPQGFPPPANLFDISFLPWTTFTSFALHVENGWDHVAPVFTVGRFARHGDRLVLPLAMQIHHAAADGFHTSRLLGELQDLLADPARFGSPGS